MNQSLIKLQEISHKKKRVILGLMSGTSLDGLDIALCQVSGSGEQTEVNLRKFTTVDYNKEQKKLLKKISSVEVLALKELCYMHTWLAHLHASMINDALQEWGIDTSEVDCIASHGQTIYHYPARDQDGVAKPINSTLQIADGDHIAALTGIIIISDFRQKHTAHGGEGAPLAALVDRYLFGSETENRVLLNIGGIANYTWLPAGKSDNQKSFTTDTGPGNTLIDNLVQHFFDQPFDRDGRIAESGNVQKKLLKLMLHDPWFDEAESKSTGPEYFNIGWIERLLEREGFALDAFEPKDLIATVTELSAVTIAKNILEQLTKNREYKIYASGGGAHNPVLMKRLTELLPGAELHDISRLGLDPDAKEAVVFAVLANEALAGSGFPTQTPSGEKKVNFGKISFPA